MHTLAATFRLAAEYTWAALADDPAQTDEGRHGHLEDLTPVWRRLADWPLLSQTENV
jgi:hypothetical protein